MTLLLLKGSLSRCILAVCYRPISSCKSLGSIRSDDSKLCYKPSVALLSSSNVQNGSRINFRLISTTPFLMIVSSRHFSSVGGDDWLDEFKISAATKKSLVLKLNEQLDAERQNLNEKLNAERISSEEKRQQLFERLIEAERRAATKLEAAATKLQDAERLAKSEAKDAANMLLEATKARLHAEYKTAIMEGELSRKSIEYLKIIQKFTPRGLIEEFETTFLKKSANMEKMGLEANRKGYWRLALRQASPFQDCLLKKGVEIEKVPTIAANLYEKLAPIGCIFPALVAHTDGLVVLCSAESLEENEEHFLTCLAHHFGFSRFKLSFFGEQNDYKENG